MFAAVLSLGADLRERVESNDAPLFGNGGNSSKTYLLQRTEVSADLRSAGHWQFFVQLEDARVLGNASSNSLRSRGIRRMS